MVSWYDCVKKIYRQAGYKTEILHVITTEYILNKEQLVCLTVVRSKVSWCKHSSLRL